MKFSQNLFLYSFPILFLFLFFQNIFACSCEFKSSVYQDFDDHPIVFTGKIIASEDKYIGGFYYYEKSYRFQVIKNYKGAFDKEIVASVGENGNSCYFELSVGETYLIHAYIGGSKHMVSPCATNATIDSAKSQIFFIEEYLKGKTEPQIYGSVSIWENDLQTNKQRIRYLDNIKVIAKSQEKSFQVLTDKNGIYSLKDLPEGKYEIKPELSKYKSFDPEFQELEIDKNKDILRRTYFLGKGFHADFSFYWENEVQGKIIDGEGKPINRAKISLVPVSSTGSLIFNNVSNNTVGKYRIFGKTPGKYLLAVELDSPIEKDNKIRFYYPKTTQLNKAKIFSIEENTNLNIDFSLPSEIKVRKFSGEILRDKEIPDGSYIVVSLDSMKDTSSPENKQFKIQPLNKTDDFEFITLENEEYWLHIWLYKSEFSNGEVKNIKKIIKSEKIKIGKEEETRKISISLP